MKKKYDNWHNYGEWHKKIYKHPGFEECLSMLKLYYLRTKGTIPPYLKITSILQTAWAVDYTITYCLKSGDKILTLNSDCFSIIKN
jgi:hypothetical protein